MGGQHQRQRFAGFAETFQELIDNKATLTNPRWVPSFDASLQDGTLIGNIGAAWEAPLFKDSAGDTGKGDWRVTQIGDWFGKWHQHRS